jgi:two-component system, LytTR family, response regulator
MNPLTNIELPLRVVIADDEPLARQRLRDLIAQDQRLHCVAEATNGPEAIELIRGFHPDLVILDINMPGCSGIEIVKAIGAQSMPMTIFITAYDQYAVKAFEHAALDYLLKPFTSTRFEEAVSRAVQQTRTNASDRFTELLETAVQKLSNRESQTTAPSGQKFLERIAVESRSLVRLVNVADIDYITASGVYAELHVGARSHLVRESLQCLESRLDPNGFFRIHRSTIVQLDRIDSLSRQAGSDYSLSLKNGVQLVVGRSRVRALEEWMGVK